MNRKIVNSILILLILSLACTCLPMSVRQQTAGIGLPPESDQQENAPYLGEITFCSDVSEDGDPINPTNEFPPGTLEVSALFNFENMQDGMHWGRLWKHEGEIWLDIRDDIWEDGEYGWVAYYVTSDDSNMPLSGNYSLSLYIGEVIVQEQVFTVKTEQVEVSPELAAFGAIQFGTGVTEDRVPFGVADVFEEGITEVYAVFPFFNMQDGQSFRREWLRDDEVIGSRDVEWYEGSHGFDYAYLISENGFKPGSYTLNLYIDGQIARSAGFTIYAVQPTAKQPALPHEIIDEYMMPAWENLENSEHQILRDLAQFALSNHVKIYVDPNLEHQATYRYTCSTPPVMGKIIFSLSYWEKTSWEETTATLAHELVHAYQHKTGKYRCGCSIEKEFYAWVAQFYVLQEMGRKDIIREKYSAAYDNRTGRFDSDKLWELLLKVYPECPEY